MAGAGGDPAGMPGTCTGLLGLAPKVHYFGSTIRQIRDMPSAFGLGACRATMRHAPDASTDRMGPAYGEMGDGLKDADRPGPDEAPVAPQRHAGVRAGDHRRAVGTPIRLHDDPGGAWTSTGCSKRCREGNLNGYGRGLRGRLSRS